MRIRALLFIALALAFAQMSFADISNANNGSISSCANLPSSPANIASTGYAQFGCSLYNDVSSYTINLTSLMTQDNADFYTNLVGAGYTVVINGDPNALPDDSTGLFNQNLWVAVLFWPGDQDAGTASDKLTMYWNGDPSFPTVSDVQTLDYGLYGTDDDPEFFVEQTGSETVYQPNAHNEYDVILTPEPGAILMLGAVLLTLAGGIRRRFHQ